MLVCRGEFTIHLVIPPSSVRAGNPVHGGDSAVYHLIWPSTR